MNFIRNLIAVSAVPVRLAALGVLSAGVAGGATFLLVGSPAATSALSLQTAQHVAAAPSPDATEKPSTTTPQPSAPTQRPVAVPAAVEPEDADEGSDD